jgi:hypothetical protein
MRNTLLTIVICLLLAAGCDDKNGSDDKNIEDTTLAADTVTEVIQDMNVPDLVQEIRTPDIVCKPQCEGMQCGDDGCGGSCGQCSGAQESCLDKQCVCKPSCTGKECGDDGCGNECGHCEPPYHCEGNKCECTPDCKGKECGYDGCLGECGSCESPYSCDNGTCACAFGTCTPDDNLDEVCSGEPLGACGIWECSEADCCQKGKLPPADCCMSKEDCRDCINLETLELLPCPETILDGFVTNKCTTDSCGLNNECKHFDKVVFGECNDNNPCTTDACMPDNGMCTHVDIPDCVPEG